MSGRGPHPRNVIPVLLAALGAALLAGCPSAKPVVYATADYHQWKRTTETILDYPIPGHQDRLRVPRMNAVGFTAKPVTEKGRRRWEFPLGTIIVKEVYGTPKPLPGEQPLQLTIMVKSPRDPRSQGGWIWLTRDLPEGKEMVFAGNYCITCHSNANEKHPYGDTNPQEEFRDYVYFVPGERDAGRTR